MIPRDADGPSLGAPVQAVGRVPRGLEHAGIRRGAPRQDLHVAASELDQWVAAEHQTDPFDGWRSPVVVGIRRQLDHRLGYVTHVAIRPVSDRPTPELPLREARRIVFGQQVGRQVRLVVVQQRVAGITSVEGDDDRAVVDHLDRAASGWLSQDIGVLQQLHGELDVTGRERGAVVPADVGAQVIGVPASVGRDLPVPDELALRLPLVVPPEQRKEGEVHGREAAERGDGGLVVDVEGGVTVSCVPPDATRRSVSAGAQAPWNCAASNT